MRLLRASREMHRSSRSGWLGSNVKIASSSLSLLSAIPSFGRSARIGKKKTNFPFDARHFEASCTIPSMRSCNVLKDSTC